MLVTKKNYAGDTDSIALKSYASSGADSQPTSPLLLHTASRWRTPGEVIGGRSTCLRTVVNLFCILAAPVGLVALLVIKIYDRLTMQGHEPESISSQDSQKAQEREPESVPSQDSQKAQERESESAPSQDSQKAREREPESAPSRRISFEALKAEIQIKQQGSWGHRIAPLAEKYDDYQYKTVEAYKAGKHYPSGIDARPTTFDPAGETVCAHGTNMMSVMASMQHTNMQLVGVIKQIKLMGELPQTGETRGAIAFNRDYVSTCVINDSDERPVHGDPNYDDTITYARKAATSGALGFNRSDQPLSRIPVVVVGDGAGKCVRVRSTIRNEWAYKRVNCRILAFKDETDKETARAALRELQQSTHDARIEDIRLCTFDELRACRTKDPRYADTPDVPRLWETATPVGA